MQNWRNILIYLELLSDENVIVDLVQVHDLVHLLLDSLRFFFVG
jgi:hypothetical protein